MAEHTPTRFNIVYRNGAYYVSIPNYHGGEVVDASVLDALVKALEQIAARVAKKSPRGWKIICPVCGYKSVEPDTEARHAPNCAGEVAREALSQLNAVVGQVGGSGK